MSDPYVPKPVLDVVRANIRSSRVLKFVASPFNNMNKGKSSSSSSQYQRHAHPSVDMTLSYLNMGYNVVRLKNGDPFNENRNVEDWDEIVVRIGRMMEEEENKTYVNQQLAKISSSPTLNFQLIGLGIYRSDNSMRFILSFPRKRNCCKQRQNNKFFTRLPKCVLLESTFPTRLFEWIVFVISQSWSFCCPLRSWCVAHFPSRNQD